MTNEEVLVQETEHIPFEEADSKPGGKGKFLIIQALVFAGGLTLLIFVLYKIGFNVITETISQIGWGFLIIVGTNFSRHLIRAMCIYLAIPKEHRNVRYHNVLAARLAGEAMNLMTFAGPVLG